MNKYIPVVARLLLVQIFVVSTVLQLNMFMSDPNAYEGFRVQLGMLGLPGIFAPLMILVMLIGGFALLLGFKTRVFAYVMAGYAIFMAVITGVNVLQWVSIAGGLLALSALAPTAFSVDNLLKKK